MRGWGRLRRSGAVGRRQGTRGGWSVDATEAPRCFDSASSSLCSPSRRTLGGWRSPLTVACGEYGTEETNFSIKQELRNINYHIIVHSVDGDVGRFLPGEG